MGVVVVFVGVSLDLGEGAGRVRYSFHLLMVGGSVDLHLLLN